MARSLSLNDLDVVDVGRTSLRRGKGRCSTGSLTLSLELDVFASFSAEMGELVNRKEPAPSNTNNLLQRFNELGLYGRSWERSELKKALFRLLDDESGSEIVFIDGPSGIGKTALANSIHSEVTAQNGIFVVGKHDPILRERPYSAISEACQQLCKAVKRRMNSESESLLQKRLNTKLNDLEISLLHNLVGETKELMTLSETFFVNIDDIRGTVRKQVMQKAFQKFIRIVCSFFPPVVIVLDDLQWADFPSLDLFLNLVLDKNHNNLMIIGCYRSDQVNPSGNLCRTINSLREQQKNKEYLGFTELELENLTINELTRWLVDLLSVPNDSETTKFAKLCRKRTIGNPLYVQKFLSVLYEAELLTFSSSSSKWTWDLQRTEHYSDPKGSLVNLIGSRIVCASADLLSLLMFASCLGPVFDERHLALVWRKSRRNSGETKSECIGTVDRFEQLRDQAVNELFLACVGDSHYRFVHDCVKETVLSLQTKEQRDIFQREVGMRLFHQLDGGFSDRMTFVVANLLNNGRGADLVSSHAFLLAATSALRKTAFSTALKYSRDGIRCLPGNMWSAQISVDLHLIAAEACCCIGMHENAKIYCNAILSQKKVSQAGKMAAHRVMVKNLPNVEALEYSLDILDSMGCSFPREKLPQSLHASISLRRAGATKHIPKFESMSDLPAMDDPEKRHLMELMNSAFALAYAQENTACFVLVICRMVRWTLKFGLHESSPSAFACLASCVVHLLGDFQNGKALANIALALLNKLENKSGSSSTLFFLNSFISSWFAPSVSRIDVFAEGYKSGASHGDTYFASCTAVSYISTKLLSGRDLESLENDCRKYVTRIEAWNHPKQAGTIRVLWQSILNLAGNSTKTTHLTGIATNEEKCLSSQSPCIALFMQFMKNFLCLYFGEYELGANLALKRGDRFLKSSKGQFIGYDPFVRASCLYAAARAITKRHDGMKADCVAVARRGKLRALYLSHAEKIRSVVEAWVKGGAFNHIHQLSIMNAEFAALTNKNKGQVSELYKHAIIEATRSGFKHNIALAEERYADFLFDFGGAHEASMHCRSAIQLYKEWGAYRKMESLRKKHKAIVDKYTSSSFIALMRPFGEYSDDSDSDEDTDESVKKDTKVSGKDLKVDQAWADAS